MSKCHHCNETGACDCQLCKSGKLICKSKPDELGEQYVNYSDGDRSWYREYRECSKCNGTGTLQSLPLRNEDKCIHCNSKGVCNCHVCKEKMPFSFTAQWGDIKEKCFIENEDMGRWNHKVYKWHICSICEGIGKIKHNITNLTLSDENNLSEENKKLIETIIKKLKEENNLIEQKLKLGEIHTIEIEKQIELELEKQKTLEKEAKLGLKKCTLKKLLFG